jgi:hypothetical protein
MYTRAKKIRVEFMYALDCDEEGAEEYRRPLEERFAATAAVRSYRGHRGRRFRERGSEPAARRPRAAGWPMVERSIGLPAGRPPIVTASPFHLGRSPRAGGSALRVVAGGDPVHLGLQRLEAVGPSWSRSTTRRGRFSAKADRGRGGDSDRGSRGGRAIAAAPVTDTIKRWNGRLGHESRLDRGRCSRSFQGRTSVRETPQADRAAGRAKGDGRGAGPRANGAAEC